MRSKKLTFHVRSAFGAPKRVWLSLAVLATMLIFATSALASSGPTTELVGNSDFELFHDDWTEPGVQVIFPAGNLPVAPYSGVYAAYFSNKGTTDLFQNVNIPSNINFAKLHLWYYTTIGSRPNGHTLYVMLNDPTNGTHLVEAMAIDALPATQQWLPLTYILTPADLNAIRGKTVRLLLRSTPLDVRSQFLIDDVSLDIGQGNSRHLYLPLIKDQNSETNPSK